MSNERNTTYEWQTDRGPVAIRTMVPSDIPAAMVLKNRERWNQLEQDWELYLAVSPGGCGVAACGDATVGTVNTAAYEDRIGWIGMLLVDEAFRRMGIGSRLLAWSTEALQRCDCIKLDATPAGQPIYERRGFAREYRVLRFVAPDLSEIPDPAPAVERLTAEDVARAAAFDAPIFGASRRELLAGLRQLLPERAWKLERDGALRAVCLGRPGMKYSRVGPLVAETLDDAKRIAATAVQDLRGGPVVFDVPEMQEQFCAWLGQFGFAEGTPFMRMFLGRNVPGDPSRNYAILGGELG